MTVLTLPQVTMGVDAADAITAIGTKKFGHALLTCVHRLSGADYCSVFEFQGDNPVAILSLGLDGGDIAVRQGKLYNKHKFWSVDPTIQQIKSWGGSPTPAVVRRRIEDYENPDLKNVIFRPWKVVDRAVLFGNPASPKIGLTVSTSESVGAFGDAGLSNLRDTCAALLALVTKHLEIQRSKMQISTCLRSLDLIDRLVAASAADLTKREVQVCARIIYGLTAFAIASDLQIGEESVMTYRKRAYQKLGIATQRELAMWFIDKVEGHE